MFTEDIKVYVEGYFSGPEDYTFEVRMTSSNTFQWRKYRTGDSVCKTSTTGPWCAFRGTGTLSESHATLLEHGVYIMFATLEGKTTGDKWIFDAYTFWSTTFSPVQFTGNVNASPDDALLYVQGSFIETLTRLSKLRSWLTTVSFDGVPFHQGPQALLRRGRKIISSGQT